MHFRLLSFVLLLSAQCLHWKHLHVGQWTRQMLAFMQRSERGFRIPYLGTIILNLKEIYLSLSLLRYSNHFAALLSILIISSKFVEIQNLKLDVYEQSAVLKEAIDDLEWPGSSIEIVMWPDPPSVTFRGEGHGDLQVLM